jgi:prepilin-type N-terminal cleavage/methylation domain-containing protein
MSGNKGFTLIEVVIAVTIIAIAFGVLLDLLYKAKQDIEISEKIFTD